MEVVNDIGNDCEKIFVNAVGDIRYLFEFGTEPYEMARDVALDANT